MCGIAGFLNTNGSPADERLVRRMTDVIAHRGPDGSGHYVRGEVALGHRRLSIIDLATGGQPMSNENDSVWVTYNGEIFNHADIRPELEAAGHRYKSHCDTETIIHAYEQWGDQSVTRYRGMFAYAIWDQNKRQLFCVRDRLGIKPFYYYWDGRLFAFASEIKALLQHPDDQRALQRRTAARVSGLRIRQRRRNDVRRHSQADARPHPDGDAAGPDPAPGNQAVLGSPLPHAIRRASRPRMDRRVPLATRSRSSACA